MKFDHSFKLYEKSKTGRTYICDNTVAKLDFISPAAIRVAIYKKGAYMLPTFTINPNNDLSQSGRDKLATDAFEMFEPIAKKTDNGEKFILKNGIEVNLDLHNFLLSYEKNGKRIFADRAPLAYNIDGEFGTGAYHYISREDDEKIFGLGDKAGKTDKRGKTYRIETADSMGFDAEYTDPLYKHIPFYICQNSVMSYGIYYDASNTSFIDLGREINNYYEHFKFFKTDDDYLVYYVFFGSTLSVLQQYNRLCGKQAFPPKWSFDYCASTMAYTDAENAEEEMYKFLDKINDLDIACQGFYLSSGYTQIGNLRCVFHWNKEKFPKPEKFISDFKEKGIHLIPNIKPAFLTSHPMYDEIKKQGLFVKNTDGTPYVTQFWDGLGSYIDFTNPKGFEFWNRQVKEKLLDLGIDATWNDNNEFDIKACDSVASGFGKEVRASEIRPILTYLMVLSSYKAQVDKYPNTRPFLSSRSGSSAIRRLAQTWSGDNFTSFHDLRFCHYVGMTLSLSGLYFYGHDLGGFSGDMPSEELLLRWMQHGVFEPRFTIHSWNKDNSATMPWSYEDKIDAAKEILAERKRLIPYLYNCAYEAVENELPIQAPPFIYFDDKNIDVNTTSFMLGRKILAKCVLDEGKDSVNIYLPKGEIWYLNGKKFTGGQNVELKIPADKEVPYFVKGGCVLPSDEGEYGFKKSEKLVFTVYPNESGEFKDTFFTDDGISYEYQKGNCAKLEFNVKANESEIELEVNNSGNMNIDYEIRLVETDKRKLVIK